MNGTAVAKGIVRFVASISVGTVVANAVKMNTPAEIGTIEKVLVIIGSGIISGMVSDKGADYAAKIIDDIGSASKQTPAAT